MASSSDPEKDSDKSQPKSDNPFIKFRQFADEQISSLLQGIIGLPSAFSGKPSENQRWAIFDEDLRRRDELQARQQELRESEARRVDKHATEADEDLPVRTMANWGAFTRWLKEAPPGDHDNDGMRDVPLYSPVTKSLFAHLRQSVDGDEDWTNSDDCASNWPQTNVWLVKPYERSSNPLITAQYMIRNDLNFSSMFRSNYSLLPYMLFSPYSPLRLMEGACNTQPERRDMFPYIDAFEDLIRTTQPGQQPLLVSRLFGNGFRVRNPESEGDTRMPDSDLFLMDPATKAHLYRAQLHWMHRKDILQERRIAHLPQFKSPPSTMSQDRESDRMLIPKEAQTEQEMYEYFLRWASQTNQNLEPMFAKAKAAFEKELEAGKAANADPLQVFAKLLESTSLKDLAHKFQEDLIKSVLDIEKPRHATQKAESENSSEDPSRVVSESTTTQRVKQVDGSVRTYVHHRKVFANGCEEETTSSHIEEDRDENDHLRPMVSMEEQSKVEEKRIDDTKKAPKKGWFWN